MADDYQRIKRVFVSTTPGDQELAVAAKELGLKPDDLRKMMRFTDAVRRCAEEEELSPPQVIGAMANLIGDVLLSCYPEEVRGDLVADLNNQFLLLLQGDATETTH